jgi:glycerophosphoryl diester phosphodiesterase
MQSKLLIFLFATCFFSSCAMQKWSKSKTTSIDYQAHRGGRGLMPENTIPAMLSVMDNEKVITLEMDLAITKDKQVVVSHDPILNPLITTKPDGDFIKANEVHQNIIYQMNYDVLRKFDVGKKQHPAFPAQKKIPVCIPTFSDLVDSVEAKSTRIGRKIFYNIEIKSVDGKDDMEHPGPQEFVDLVVNLVKQKQISQRTTIQSFDIRPLQIIHKKYPKLSTAYLVEGKQTGDIAMQLDKLGFTPTIYSPDYKYVTKPVVDYCHAHHMKIIPWTVNTKKEIEVLVALGVDGIITDYPNLLENIGLPDTGVSPKETVY